MPGVAFSYQVLMKAVYASTDARGSVYPHDFNYVAIPLAEARSIIADYDPSPSKPENGGCHDQARKLWCKFRRFNPASACGIVRLVSPLPYDLVGIVTSEDLIDTDIGKSCKQSSLERDMLNNDLSEIPDDPISLYHSDIFHDEDSRSENPQSKMRFNDLSSDTARVEMTLIDPQTKSIFKRSQGGTFGTGRWPVSEIRAFAVWF